MKLGYIAVLLLATSPLTGREAGNARAFGSVAAQTAKSEGKSTPIMYNESKLTQQECVKCRERTWSATEGMCSKCYLAFRENRAVASTIEELLGLKDSYEAADDLATRFSKKSERSKSEQAVIDLLRHRFHIACDGFDGFMGNTGGRGYDELMNLLSFFDMRDAMVLLKEYRTKIPSDYKAFSEWENRLRDAIKDEAILQYVRTHRQEFK